MTMNKKVSVSSFFSSCPVLLKNGSLEVSILIKPGAKQNNITGRKLG